MLYRAMARTRCPRRTRASTRCEPMKPSAPVTATYPSWSSSRIIFPISMAIGDLLVRVPHRPPEHDGRVEPSTTKSSVHATICASTPRSRTRSRRPARWRRRPAGTRSAQRLQHQRQEHGAAQGHVRRDCRTELRDIDEPGGRRRPRPSARSAPRGGQVLQHRGEQREPGPAAKARSRGSRSSRWVRRRYQSRLHSAAPMLSDSGSAASSAPVLIPPWPCRPAATGKASSPAATSPNRRIGRQCADRGRSAESGRLPQACAREPAVLVNSERPAPTASTGVAASSAQAAWSRLARRPKARNAALPSTPGRQRGEQPPLRAEHQQHARAEHVGALARRRRAHRAGRVHQAAGHGHRDRHHRQPGQQAGPHHPPGLYRSRSGPAGCSRGRPGPGSRPTRRAAPRSDGVHAGAGQQPGGRREADRRADRRAGRAARAGVCCPATGPAAAPARPDAAAPGSTSPRPARTRRDSRSASRPGR